MGLGLVGLGVLALALGVNWPPQPGAAAAAMSAPPVPATPIPTGSRPAPPVQRDGAAGGRVSDDVPDELAAFFARTSDEQLEQVTRLQSNPFLDPRVVAFLMQAIRDRRLEETVRNNMANALLNQPHPDPGLSRVFAAMIDDPQESFRWREYAVQHLAVSVASSAHREEAIAKLVALGNTGEKGIAGTALLHLHRLEAGGFTTLGADYVQRLLACIDDPACDLLTRMTALGIVQERRERAALASVRQLAATGVPALRRVAIATLGTIGDDSDRALLEAAGREADAGLVAAAAGSLQRLGQPSLHRTMNRTEEAVPAPAPPPHDRPESP